MKLNSPITKDGLLKCKSKATSLFSNYWYLLVAFLIPAVLTFLMYLARGHFPLAEDGSVLVIDLNAQYSGFFEALRNFAVNRDTSLLYSFSRQLGGEFMGIYDYYLASPFSYIVALFPEDRMLEALLCMFMVKAGMCGATMAFYLHHSAAKINRLAIIAFSTMYALAAYAVVYQHNTMWIDTVMWLPLVIYGVEQLVKYGKYKMFVISIAMTMITQYYTGYMVCITVLIYFFVYIFCFKDSNNPFNERLHGIRSFLRIGFYTVIGLGIAAFAILTAYYSLQFGKNEFSSPDWSFDPRFKFFELFYKFLPGSYDTAHRGGYPWMYCGVLALIMAPMYFFNKKIKTKEKAGYAIILTILLFSMISSPIDIIWHGFQKPNELEYRYSFIFCFFMIVLAYKAFANMRYSSRKPILMSVGLIGFGVMLLETFAPYIKENINKKIDVHTYQTVWLTIGLLIVYTILVCLIPRVKNKELISIGLVFVVCAEIFANGLFTLNDVNTEWNFGEYSPYVDYFRQIRPVVNTVQDNDTSFYRMEKVMHRKSNDNLALQIRGLTNSTSTLNQDTIYFLRRMGYTSKSNWSEYRGGTPVNDSILGIKYIVAYADKQYDDENNMLHNMKEYYGDPIYTHDDWEVDLKNKAVLNDYEEWTHFTYDNTEYVVYENPYHLSIAFLSDVSIKYFKLDDYENPFERMNHMVAMMLGEDEPLPIFVPANQVSMDLKDISTTSSAGIKPVHAVYSFKESGSSITYKYEVPTNTELFVYFPTDYERKMNMSINNGKSITWGDNDNWKILSIGESLVEDITIKLTENNTYDNFWIYKETKYPFVYSLNMEVFADAMARLQKGNVQIDPEKYREDYLPGTVTTTKNHQLVMTTIPYDKGWQVKVDGKKVETIELADALMGYYIDQPGDHEIVMKYQPKEFVLGMAGSVFFLAVFVLLIVFEKKLRKINGYGEFFAVPQTVSAPESPDDNVDAQDNDNNNNTKQQ